MPYQKLLVPSGTPSNLEKIVREQLDPLLTDVHAMLRLPIKGEHGLEAGCNLSAALVLLEVVGGVSVEVYDSELDKRNQSGERFKRVLQYHFPWKCERKLPGAITDREAAEQLYKAFRNPLVHRLGTYDGGVYLGKLKVAKEPLLDQQIEAIEKSETRPENWTRPTLATDAEGTKMVLTVKYLYWGIRRMIYTLLEECIKNGVQDLAAGDGFYVKTTAAAGPITTLPVSWE